MSVVEITESKDRNAPMRQVMGNSTSISPPDKSPRLMAPDAMPSSNPVPPHLPTTTTPAPRRRPWQEIASEARQHRADTLSLIHPALDFKNIPPISSCPYLPENNTATTTTTTSSGSSSSSSSSSKNQQGSTQPDAPPPQSWPLRRLDLASQLLSAAELEITTLPVRSLLSALASGRFSAVSVARAFLRRAAVAQHLTNCLAEVLGERALARARHLDGYRARTGRVVGVLHGLPVSVKEHVGVGGLRLHASYIALWENVAGEDARVIAALEAAGALVFARTAEPQGIMHLETRSNYFGSTVNPYQRQLSAGGSSGGEGALIGLRGSCLGVGTDVGGSVRSPAANCGVYGLKPTAGRIPVGGWWSAPMGTDNIIPVIGPLSTDIEGIKLFMQVCIDAKPWLTEPSLLPIPWRKDLTEFPWCRKLKIGVLWDDGVVRPHPPITRALREVVAKLKDVPGIEVTEWKPFDHERAWRIAASLYFIDGGKEEEDLIAESGEPWLPLTKYIVQDNEYCKRLSIEELWQWQSKREVYREAYAKVWNDTATTSDRDDMMDAILSPAGPAAAPVLETAKWWGYTSQWNVLDYPAIVFPVTKCDSKVDTKDRDYEPRNRLDEESWNTYDPEKYHGVPVSLQLICRRYEDEKVVGVLDSIRKTIGLPFVEFP